MKMQLYDIRVLATLRKNKVQEKDFLAQEKKVLLDKQYNINAKLQVPFNNTPYAAIPLTPFNHFLVPAFCTFLFLAFLAYICNDIVSPLVFFFFFRLCEALSFYSYRHDLNNRKYENYRREQEKKAALKTFNEQHEEAQQLLSCLRKDLASLDEKQAQIDKSCSCVDQQLLQLYRLEILHPNYQDPQICGVMFQLFDTGRVHNLTEAMNLYEDLRWKAEMQSLLQSLIEKVDDMLSIVSNIEYYSRCALENQKETHRLLNGVSMRMSQISESQEAVRINTDVLRANSETMQILQEMDFIRRS